MRRLQDRQAERTNQKRVFDLVVCIEVCVSVSGSRRWSILALSGIEKGKQFVKVVGNKKDHDYARTSGLSFDLLFSSPVASIKDSLSTTPGLGEPSSTLRGGLHRVRTDAPHVSSRTKNRRRARGSSTTFNVTEGVRPSILTDWPGTFFRPSSEISNIFYLFISPLAQCYRGYYMR